MVVLFQHSSSLWGWGGLPVQYKPLLKNRYLMTAARLLILKGWPLRTVRLTTTRSGFTDRTPPVAINSWTPATNIIIDKNNYNNYQQYHHYTPPHNHITFITGTFRKNTSVTGAMNKTFYPRHYANTSIRIFSVWSKRNCKSYTV